MEPFKYAKMPPHMKKMINQVDLEKCTFEQIVKNLERDLAFNGLKNPDYLQRNNVSQHATNTNNDRRKPTCHHFIRPGHYRNSCHQLKKQKEQTEGN